MAGFWAVDTHARGLIENLVPGRHPGLPITFTIWSGEPIESGELFLLNVYCHQSNIIDDMTHAAVVPGFEVTRERMIIDDLFPDVTVDPNKLSPDIHMWREDRYLTSHFVSDTFYDRLSDLDVQLPLHRIKGQK